MQSLQLQDFSHSAPEDGVRISPPQGTPTSEHFGNPSVEI